jgi:hypothetical protein
MRKWKSPYQDSREFAVEPECLAMVIGIHRSNIA